MTVYIDVKNCSNPLKVPPRNFSPVILFQPNCNNAIIANRYFHNKNSHNMEKAKIVLSAIFNHSTRCPKVKTEVINHLSHYIYICN